MQLRREISDKATFYSGRGQWLHALLRAISNNREFVYYSCFPCNRCRFFIRVYEKIHHFHIDHNAAWIHPKFCISIVFDFSWDDCSTLEKLETMVKQYIFFFGGRGGTTCIMVYVKMANGWIQQDILQYVVFASLTASLNKYLIRSIFSSFPRQDRIIESTYITLKKTKQNTRS